MTFSTPIPPRTIESFYDIRGGKLYACFLVQNGTRKKGTQSVQAVFLTETKSKCAKTSEEDGNLIITIC